MDSEKLSPLDRVYRHYGDGIFLKEKQEQVLGTRMMKPLGGGIWASPVDSDVTWDVWCSNEHFHEDSLAHHFEFRLRPEARIFVINNDDDFFEFIKKYPGRPTDTFEKKLYSSFDEPREVECFPDYIKATKDYDGLEVNISKDPRLYHLMYGWDVDSIVIWNYDIIEELTP